MHLFDISKCLNRKYLVFGIKMTFPVTTSNSIKKRHRKTVTDMKLLYLTKKKMLSAGFLVQEKEL